MCLCLLVSTSLSDNHEAHALKLQSSVSSNTAKWQALPQLKGCVLNAQGAGLTSSSFKGHSLMRRIAPGMAAPGSSAPALLLRPSLRPGLDPFFPLLGVPGSPSSSTTLACTVHVSLAVQPPCIDAAGNLDPVLPRVWLAPGTASSGLP